MRWPVAGLAGAILLAQLGLTITNIALPTIMSALDVPFAAVQWVVLSYLVTMTALAVYAGKLGDRYGKRRLLFIGLGLFAVSSALCAATPNLPLLIAGRAAQGAGAALLNALALALVVEVAPAGQAGGGVGFISATSAIGTMIGPTAGAFLIGLGGWRAIFAVNVPVALAIGLALYLSTRTTQSTVHAAPTAPVPGLDPALSASLAMNALVSGVMMSTLMLGPFVLSRTFGLPLHGVGFAMALGPLTTALTAIPAGRLADRLGGRTMTIVGLVVFTIGAAGLAILQTGIGLVSYLVPVVLVGFGYGLFQTSNNAVVISGCEPTRRGTVSGWLSLSRNIGLISGAAVIGALFGAVTHGDAQSGAVVATAMRTAFTAASAMGLLAIALASFVYVTRPRVSAPRSLPING